MPTSEIKGGAPQRFVFNESHAVSPESAARGSLQDDIDISATKVTGDVLFPFTGLVMRNSVSSGLLQKFAAAAGSVSEYLNVMKRDLADDGEVGIDTLASGTRMTAKTLTAGALVAITPELMLAGSLTAGSMAYAAGLGAVAVGATAVAAPLAVAGGVGLALYYAPSAVGSAAEYSVRKLDQGTQIVGKAAKRTYNMAYDFSSRTAERVRKITSRADRALGAIVNTGTRAADKAARVYDAARSLLRFVPTFRS